MHESPQALPFEQILQQLAATARNGSARNVISKDGWLCAEVERTASAASMMAIVFTITSRMRESSGQLAPGGARQSLA